MGISKVKLARQDNIIAIKTAKGGVVGFHAHNLEVARLDERVWSSMQPLDQNHSLDGEILFELDSWNREINLETTDSHLEQKVRSYSVNVSQVCNLKCTYCAADGDGTFGEKRKHIESSVIENQIRHFLHDVAEGEVFDITFFGGEPLIALDTIRALSRFARMQVAGRGIDLRFRVITNGTLVDAKAAELLASIGCHVTVSIDGPPEVNDRQRKTAGGQGSTARALKGVAELLKVRDRLGSLSFGAVFGTHHTGVLETYKFLRPFNFDAIKFDFAAEANDAEASREFADQMALTADYAFENGGENELRKIGAFDHYFRALDQQKRAMNHCGAGKSHLYADAQGRLSACQWFIGKSAEQVGRGLELDGAKLKTYAPPLQEQNNCQSCWARHLCGGGCVFVNQLKNGQKNKKDAEFCLRTRTTIAKAIEHYAESRADDRAESRADDRAESRSELQGSNE
jgi:uncharacterized protein